jgi:predicted hydrocarbon binding protein
MEEIIGADEARSVLALSGLSNLGEERRFSDSPGLLSFEKLTLLQNALEQAYGPQAGRGLALRIGRCSFHHILRLCGAELHLTDTSFRLLPLSQKLERNLDTLADLFGHIADPFIVEVKQGESKFVWQMSRRMPVEGKQADSPACSLIVGLLQESLYWASGGKIFKIAETGCMAWGDSLCTIEVDLHPIG